MCVCLRYSGAPIARTSGTPTHGCQAGTHAAFSAIWICSGSGRRDLLQENHEYHDTPASPQPSQRTACSPCHGTFVTVRRRVVCLALDACGWATLHSQHGKSEQTARANKRHVHRSMMWFRQMAQLSTTMSAARCKFSGARSRHLRRCHARTPLPQRDCVPLLHFKSGRSPAVLALVSHSVTKIPSWMAVCLQPDTTQAQG